jgi:hypothetical protein
MDEVTPEVKIDQLLQLLAVLVERLGGEVVISRKEFTMLEGVLVLGRHLSPEYVALRLAIEDEQPREPGRPLDDWIAE